MKKHFLLLLAFLWACSNSEEIQEFDEDLRIAFVSNRGGTIDIYSINPDGSELKQLTNTEDRNSFPEYVSPERLRFTIVDKENRYLKHELDLHSLEITPFVMDTVSAGADFQWFSKDSSKIIYRAIQNDVLEFFLMNKNGSGRKRITRNKETDTPALLPNPFWNSDETKIAYMNGPDYYNQSLKIYDIETEETSIITPRGYMNSGMFWHKNDNTFTLNIKVRDSTTYELWNIDVDGNSFVPLTDNPGLGSLHPKISPDGKWMVFESARDDEAGDIFIMRLDGTDLRKITSSNAYDGRPEWIYERQKP